ncbi:MAG: twin-arginine translocase TatA/TatE family subunit [Desulfatibacillum sp.]|nr:twin-arginine translocase TatA/TatE family subunit [Desulfatibacillum sp.]
MFGIGMQELVVILLVALIFIGPKKLPEIAQALGKGFAEFRKATQEFKDTLNIDNDVSQVKSAFKDMQDEVKGAVSDAKKTPKIWEDPPVNGNVPKADTVSANAPENPEDPYKAQDVETDEDQASAADTNPNEDTRES